MKTVGYAIVGTGYFGAELGRIMKEQEGAKIVAVLDPENGQTIADELGCDVETDLDTLYSRDDVDAVIVATPNYLHKEPVVKAAEHGVNVFCEKPIALSYQDCDDMVRACQEHGVIFMAGHVMNFFHGVRHAKKLINDGVIGKVLYCHSARNGWEEQQPTISWKKIREKSGGHLYHHIHELDCVQFLMGGMPEEVTMTGGNVAHQGEAFGDEDDMLFVNMQFSDNRYAVLEWGSEFHWPEHYVLIQGTKGAIKIDMCDCGGTLKIDGKDEHFLVHESQEEDDDRTRIYHSTEMDGAIMYGKPGKKPPMWLHSIMKNEMKYLNGILHGKEVDEYNLYKNGEALTCKQYDYNFEGTSLLETPTDTDVNMNVFYKDSMFKVFPTNYLAMKYSDDEGDNWSDLNIVSTFKPEESKFLVLGPGIGKQITTGENAGRLIVPLYSKSSAELGFMYSDDHGNSWNYVEADHNTGGATAEAQIVEMPDGSLKTYLRTGSGYIAEVTSIDGGETWSDRVPLTEIATTSYGTQLSVINYSQPIDGKPAIILSAPNATNGRKNGKIWIGLINETGQSGVNKYSVEWKYCYSVDTPQMGYSYSCLTELPDGKVGLLYEKYDSWSRNELHLKNILKYEKFTIDELKVQP